MEEGEDDKDVVRRKCFRFKAWVSTVVGGRPLYGTTVAQHLPHS